MSIKDIANGRIKSFCIAKKLLLLVALLGVTTSYTQSIATHITPSFSHRLEHDLRAGVSVMASERYVTSQVNLACRLSNKVQLAGMYSGNTISQMFGGTLIYAHKPKLERWQANHLNAQLSYHRSHLDLGSIYINSDIWSIALGGDTDWGKFSTFYSLKLNALNPQKLGIFNPNSWEAYIERINSIRLLLYPDVTVGVVKRGKKSTLLLFVGDTFASDNSVFIDNDFKVGLSISVDIDKKSRQ